MVLCILSLIVLIIGIIAFLFTEAASLFTLYILVSSVPNIDGYTIYHIGLLDIPIQLLYQQIVLSIRVKKLEQRLLRIHR